MTDLHTHILPYIDDGAKNDEMALEMVQSAYAQGVKTLVFTPHYYGKSSVEGFLEQRQIAFERIKDGLPAGMDVRLGAEVHFNRANLFRFEEISALKIEGTKYILIELPFMDEWSSGILEKLYSFIYETDCIPILAHIERYLEVRKNPKILTKLVEMGCLIQVNTSSFLEKADKSFAFCLLKKELVHCLGSDTHDTTRRTCDYALAKEEIEREGYASQFEKIQENMQRILADGEVFVGNPKKVKKIFRFYY